ncbi:MAG: hypothetical protein FVQ82_15600 [Planctomycetes bacterium]|nr:hypothetical protein [Planctomycetota bacterium]
MSGTDGDERRPDECVPERRSDAGEGGDGFASLLPRLEEFGELGLATLAHHARQCDATAADGYFHASANEARAFLEALVIGMALAGSGESLAEFRRANRASGCLRVAKRRLMENGLLDADDEQLVQQVYAISAARGEHPGVADGNWSRLVRRIVRAAVCYLIERYAACRTLTVRRAPCSAVPARSRPCRTTPAGSAACQP